jgi:hypothetical protein
MKTPTNLDDGGYKENKTRNVSIEIDNVESDEVCRYGRGRKVFEMGEAVFFKKKKKKAQSKWTKSAVEIGEALISQDQVLGYVIGTRRVQKDRWQVKGLGPNAANPEPFCVFFFCSPFLPTGIGACDL